MVRPKTPRTHPKQNKHYIVSIDGITCCSPHNMWTKLFQICQCSWSETGSIKQIRKTLHTDYKVRNNKYQKGVSLEDLVTY